MIRWIISWLLFSASAGVIWEFALHEPPTAGGVAARGILVLFGVLLLMALTVVWDFWGSLAHHAWSEYPWNVARKLIAFHALCFLLTVAPCLWLARRALQWAWPRILSWFNDPQWSESIVTAIPATLPTIGLLFAATALLAWLVFRAAMSQPFYAYGHALEVLGPRKLALGIVLMTYLRTLVPRRDFFLQAPVFSWIPVLAMCTVIHELIPIRAFAVAIPILIVILLLPMWANAVAPPLWIYLATSEAESFSTFWSIRQTWRRHGVNLLDRTGPGGRDFYDASRKHMNAPPHLFYDPGIGRVWSLRTRPAVWRIAVRLLAAFVPVVAVDWRDPSAIVKSEVEWLERKGLAGKSYFVAPPARSAATSDPPPSSILVDENVLIAARWTGAGISVVQRAGRP